jgi:hypothetical protein
MVHTTKRSLFLLLIVFLLTACGSAGSRDAQLGDIHCHVFYRAAAGESLTESPVLTLSPEGAADSIPFEDMEFQAQFLSDAFEGKSLSIVVIDAGTTREITRALYQIDSELGLTNQYFCDVD